MVDEIVKIKKNQAYVLKTTGPAKVEFTHLPGGQFQIRVTDLSKAATPKETKK